MKAVAGMLVCLMLAACGVKGELKHGNRSENPEKPNREWEAKPGSYGH